MDTPVALTIDQYDEIHKNLRRARAMAKLVAELAEGRENWPDTFTISEMGTIMHLIAEEVATAQGMLEGCAKERHKENAGDETPD